MRQNKQAFKHEPSNGTYGDCFRTAVSCVLELPRDVVPHVFHDGCTGTEADERMDAWLAERGLTQIVIAFGPDISLEQVLAPINSASPKSRPEYRLYGQSKNGFDHVVVCRGNEIVWDPAIDDSGIIGPCKDGYFWLVFLSVTRPTGKLDLQERKSP